MAIGALLTTERLGHRWVGDEALPDISEQHHVTRRGMGHVHRYAHRYDHDQRDEIYEHFEHCTDGATTNCHSARRKPSAPEVAGRQRPRTTSINEPGQLRPYEEANELRESGMCLTLDTVHYLICRTVASDLRNPLSLDPHLAPPMLFEPIDRRTGDQLTEPNQWVDQPIDRALIS